LTWRLVAAAAERLGHPNQDRDPHGGGAQGTGEECQEGTLHAGSSKKAHFMQVTARRHTSCG